MEIDLNEKQEDIIHQMVPMYGETPSDVVAFIVTAYLHENAGKVFDLIDLVETCL